MTPTTTLYGIPNCDTVKRARGWLSERSVAHVFHDFKKSGVPAARLDAWIKAQGWEKVLNRKGNMWRTLDAATQAGVVDASTARAVMLEQSSTINRPVVEWASGAITVGFDEADWLRRV